MLESSIDPVPVANDGAPHTRAHWQTFINDVVTQPSVGPGAGWIVGGLIALVVWLTVTYAPGAVAPAGGSDAEQNIPVSAGYWTIGLVSAMALAVGWEPIISRWLGDGWSARRRAWLSRQRPWLRLPLSAIGRVFAFLYLVPSLVISFFDYLLARPIAILAGTTLRPIQVRYAAIFAWVLGGAALGWVAPAPYGLIGVGAAILAVASVVRRWSWIERDRESFLAARGSDPDIERIGFAEDLRDEALTAIVFLFVLIPIGLHQVNMAYDAFQLEDATGTVISGEPTLWGWMGFFGAELAKAVPFVDWSEVFKVANGSPIKPVTALGAQFVFALRASLDLLLLAAVLQAWQIAARLRDQTTAFWAGQLRILDPFAERATFRPVALELVEHPHVIPTEQPPVAGFPKYERERLAEIVKGAPLETARSTVLIDPVARQGALAVLARQYPDRETSEILRDRIAHEKEDERAKLRRFAIKLASEPIHAGAVLLPLLHDENAPVGFREIAARELGRLRHRDADSALKLLSDSGEPLTVRAQAGLWLAKLGDDRAAKAVQQLASEFKPEASGAELIPVMATAYACGLLKAQPAAQIESLFAQPLRPHALRAIRNALGEMDQMVRIPSGTFMMGSPDSEEGRYDDEGPQHRVTIGKDFEFGKYAVTFDEYDAFCAAMAPEHRPVINVSWHDANAYCDWLNAFTGERYRLPSEAEWEYACRAGTTTPFSFGDIISTDQANYDGNYTYGAGQKGEYREKTMPVGSFPANPFGLHDMHGNVWEWCSDPWHENYDGAPTDGTVWLRDGDTGLRVVRGGSWFYGPGGSRSAWRYGVHPDGRIRFCGVRLARTLPL